MKIVITGGHHSSALPVIQELKKQQPDIQLVWIGHKYSMLGDKNPTLEYREITASGIPFYVLQAGKVYRTFSIVRLLKVPFGFIQAFFLLLKIKPDKILSFGGYLAVPVVVAGWLLGIPSATHEQTVVVGYANKVIALFAKKIMLSWPSSAKFFNKKKVVFTGLPLRTEIYSRNSHEFDTDNSLPTIYITAGKTGSVKINKAVKEALSELLSVANVIHQCGDHSEYKDFDILTIEYSKIDQKVPGNYFLRKFVMSDAVGEAYAKANVVVSRSGAHTTAELLALEKPCVLIPIPWVSHNEQFENAKVLKEAGLATILEEKELTPQNLVDTLKTVLRELTSIHLHDATLKDTINPNAASVIAKTILAL
ncbi:MAG: hypothetical protein ACD_22C00195G0006 [uncultured bacterium]|nr:MAG: hypothetical protein ACD_22C00195G0006 [uncultured bacterium]